MSYKIIVTPTFERDIKPLLKKYSSLKNDLASLFNLIEKEPLHGKSLGNNCYKIRLAIKSKHKGKSGGARLITFVKITNEKVFLLTIYDKSTKDDISDKELSELLKSVTK